VYQAKLMKKIGTDCPSGVQAGLDALAKTSEFTQALQKEVAASDLALEKVTACIPSIHDEASKCALGNDSIITIYEEDHTIEQRAVLTTFLKMQSGWPHRLDWMEGKRGPEGKRGMEGKRGTGGTRGTGGKGGRGTKP